LPIAEIAFETGFNSLEGVPWTFQKAARFPLSQYRCQKPPDTRSLILVLTTVMIVLSDLHPGSAI
jgi:AraC-like DNA-binding protein